ncbi:ATP-dependent Clp protease ATP-binding subunit ClpX [Roseburia sp. 831b]|uniref:ATP-dependent Clp protease ATP-binding subunit ClpX n=1 Tax=Roseburia sp. 831b TaxID=1261635 RepID=UPI0009527B58|nr:ATP-dependent Clp protease ATP-binding subunit ClpX [Roseburia sp. 831b]WVK73109.1 ATP-dependent Clp protease ATP-binding subunit ClpX [Roseburia sp. 831b]
MSEFDKDEFKEVTDMEETIDQNTKNESTKEKTDSATTQETSGGNADAATTQETSGEKEEYEEVCYICRRPEHIAGKMIQIQNEIYICRDCMQKTFDSMNHAPFPMGDMLNLGNDKMPNISMINLSDLQGFVPNNQRLKKKDKEKKKEPVLDIKAIPAPHKIKASLDEYVVGQDYAKKVMSVAVYNHYKRIANQNVDDVEIEKSNMLMIGPTGCGKTYLVKTLARLLDVPLAITDATSLTEAGYIGDDIESVVSKLLAAAGNDVEKAERGIIFIDEIDKIAKKKNTNQRDVSGESVQQGMLKLLEGAEVEVPVGASSKNAMVPMTTVNTKNILFICGGAFPDLEEIIKERLNKTSSIGFQADLKDKYDKQENLLKEVTVEDVRKFGMIPEFLGRLPIMFTLDALSEEMLVRILKEPKNAIIRQYQKLLEMDEVKLEFDEDALYAIAKKAKEKDVGARALRAIIEEFMLDIMYEIPKDDNIGSVTITKDYIEKKGGPLIAMRGYDALPEKEA